MTNFELKALIYQNKRRIRIERLKILGVILLVLIALAIGGQTYPF